MKLIAKQKILIVDDKKENLVALRQVLGEVDADVVEATTGNEALAATLEDDFAMIILDVMMPGMDGFELAEYLRGDKKTRHIPIVFLTAAHADERHMFKGYQAGGIDYITKPYQPEVMVSKVNVLLEMDRNRQELERHRNEQEALVAKRTKEIKCLQTISSLVAKARETVEETLEAAVELIPPGWQYPEITCARVVFQNKEYATANFKETQWRQSASIDLSGQAVGRVDVFYLQEKPEAHEGPFLGEERELIDDIARHFGVIIQRKRVEKSEKLLLKQQTIVNNLALELGNVWELDKIYSVIYNHIKSIMDADVFIVSLYDSEKKLLRAGYVISDGNVLDIGDIPPIPLKKEDHGTQSRVIHSGKPYYMPDYRNATETTADSFNINDEDINKDGPPPAEEQERESATKSALYVSMKIRGESYGAMQVQSNRLNAYRKEDIDIFDAMANMAAVLINNAMLIDERRQAEEEREKLHSQLAQSQKMESIGRLAGGVAHDFNNMLGVILGHADMILAKMDTNQPYYSALTEINKAAERSADLTRQLLAFARKQTVAPKVIDLNKAVEGMLKMLKRMIGEDIDLAWIPEEKVWPVRIDPGQVNQILANLCVNARDAIADVGKVTIETWNKVFDEEYCKEQADLVPGEYVMLVVSDNGCGMDAETLENVFEPFFTTKELDKGTGLGLATVYGIVKQNKGCINVYSEQGHGTAFRIYLPHIAARAEETKEPRAQAVERGSETILLVEDEPGILKMTTMMLKQTGYKVIPVGTPGEAIALAREHTGGIHMLMTDVVMPEMNGRDLAKNLLSIYPDIRLLFMSGYTSNMIAHHGVLDEGVHFIQKPFSVKDLGAKIREALV